jgi:hypothetical protein
MHIANRHDCFWPKTDLPFGRTLIWSGMKYFQVAATAPGKVRSCVARSSARKYRCQTGFGVQDDFAPSVSALSAALRNVGQYASTCRTRQSYAVNFVRSQKSSNRAIVSDVNV